MPNSEVVGERRGRMPLYVLLALVMLFLLFFLAWRLIWGGARVDYLIMEPEEAVETLLVSGRVLGEGEVPLAFQLPGRLDVVNAGEGERVQAGAFLAEIDDSQIQVQAGQLESQLDSARVALSRLRSRDLPQAREALNQAATRVDYARQGYEQLVWERLEPAEEILRRAESREQEQRARFQEREAAYRSGELAFDLLLESQQRWDESIAELERARAEVRVLENEADGLRRELELARSQQRAARAGLNSLQNEDLRQARLNVEQAAARLEQAELDLDNTRLEAPFAGIVIRVAASRGQFVAAGQEVLSLIPLSGETVIEVRVDEEFTGRVAPGQEALVASSAFPEQVFPATVQRLAPTVDAERGTLPLRLVLDSFSEELLPDLAITAEIITGRRENSLILERGYTFSETGTLYVLTYTDGRAEKREIAVEDLGGGLLLVTSGLRAGERVLVDPGVEEGQRVRLGEALSER